uniref:Uncharacterized protein n=1 Tax=Mycena chlorophos TaxID=658473 RepID=A0ABQ0LQX9_MYCCL|nr:predicted protein [Mycena chlorophos]
MTSPSSSTPSLLSDTTTVSSRTLLAQYDTIPAAKDFSDALASLQSTYGFGGAVPTPIPNDVPHLIPTPSRAPTKVRDVAFDTQSSKDYERAFGDLQSSYGFCGPIGPHRTPKRTRAARKSASGLPLVQPTSKNYRVVLAKLQRPRSGSARRRRPDVPFYPRSSFIRPSHRHSLRLYLYLLPPDHIPNGQ